MVPQRSRAGAPTAVFLLVIAAVVALMGLISFTSQSGGGGAASSSATTAEEQPTFFSAVSSSGLVLQLRLNATTIESGSALAAQIALLNPLTRNLSFSSPRLPSNSTIAVWNNYDFVCSENSMWNLAGYALFKGHYSPDNLSSAGEPLALAPPAPLPCVNNARDLFVFLPNGSDATVASSSEANQPATPWRAVTNATTEYCQTLFRSVIGSTECPVGASLFGYWSTPPQGVLDSGAATTTSSYFHHFSPGQYTLVVEDIWGDTVYAHFEVVPATSPSSARSTASTSSSCLSGRPPSNSTSSTRTVAVYDVTPQFDSWEWNSTSFDVSGYTITAVGYSNTAQVVQLWPEVTLNVSNGQTTQTASFTNLGAWKGQSWPPDFPQRPVSLFNGVFLQWIFTCDMKVFLEVTVVG